MAFDYEMTPLLAKHGKDWHTLPADQQQLLRKIYEAGWDAGLEIGREEALGLDA